MPDIGIFEKVCAVLAEFTDAAADHIALESQLLGDLEINSLEIMEAVIRLEDEFQIEIPDRVIYSFRTVKDIVDYVSGQ